MRTRLLPLLLLLTAPAAAAPIPVAALHHPDPVSYEREIVPLLDAKCAACHSGSVRRGQYDVSSYESLLKGGKHGVAVVPGKPAESLLIRSAGHAAEPFMPPPKTDDPLTPQELALLTLWVERGAKGATVSRERPAVALTPLPASVRPVRALALRPDGGLLAVGRGDQVTLVEPRTGDTLRTLTDPELRPPTAHRAGVEAVALAPDGTTLASGGFREVSLWDAATGALTRRVTGFADRVVALAFSPDGKLLATGGGPATEDGEVKLIDVTTGKVVTELANAHSDTVYGVAFSPDGRTLATAAADKFVKTFEVPSGKFVRSFEGHGGHALDVAWSPDGKLLASAGADGAVKLWDFASGESVRTLGGPGKPVARLAFDGARLLAAGGDGTVRAWDAAAGAAGPALAGGDCLHALAVSPAGGLVVTGGESGEVRVYDGRDGKLVRVLAAR
jgi:WD40 repeat protein